MYRNHLSDWKKVFAVDNQLIRKSRGGSRGMNY